MLKGAATPQNIPAEAVITVIDNKIFVFGGRDRGQCFDTVSRTWTQLLAEESVLNLKRVVSINGKIYAFGEKKASIFDPMTNSVTPLPDKPTDNGYYCNAIVAMEHVPDGS